MFIRPRSLVALALVVAPGAVAGCFPPAMNEAMRRDRVSARAAFDLACQEEIQVLVIEQTTYGAIGCGRRASYVMHHCTDENYARACTIVLDGIDGAPASSGAQSPATQLH